MKRALTRRQVSDIHLDLATDDLDRGTLRAHLHAALRHIEAFDLYAAPDSDPQRVTRGKRINGDLPEFDPTTRPDNQGSF